MRLRPALEETGDPEKTADVRAAIREVGDSEVEKAAVIAWEEENPARTKRHFPGGQRAVARAHSVGEHASKAGRYRSDNGQAPRPSRASTGCRPPGAARAAR